MVISIMEKKVNREEEEPELELEDIKGVGEATAKKLREAGYADIMAIAIASPEELAEAAGITVNMADKIIREARKLVKLDEFKRASVVLEERKSAKRISFGCNSLNNLLGGGVQTRAITEFFGPFGTGKTQISHQLTVMVQLPPEKGGLNGEAIYIDTEGTFRPERLVMIAKARGLDPKKVLDRVYVARVYTVAHQILMVHKAEEYAQDHDVRLLVIDSLTSLFRAEYTGRGSLAERQQKLGRHIHDLIRFAEKYDAAVIVTNQVHARPDAIIPGMEMVSPIGGHVVGHAMTYRVGLRKGKRGVRIARIYDAPDLPEQEALFKITERGIEDATRSDLGKELQLRDGL